MNEIYERWESFYTAINVGVRAEKIDKVFYTALIQTEPQQRTMQKEQDGKIVEETVDGLNIHLSMQFQAEVFEIDKEPNKKYHDRVLSFKTPEIGQFFLMTEEGKEAISQAIEEKKGEWIKTFKAVISGAELIAGRLEE